MFTGFIRFSKPVDAIRKIGIAWEGRYPQTRLRRNIISEQLQKLTVFNDILSVFIYHCGSHFVIFLRSLCIFLNIWSAITTLRPANTVVEIFPWLINLCIYCLVIPILVAAPVIVRYIFYSLLIYKKWLSVYIRIHKKQIDCINLLKTYKNQ